MPTLICTLTLAILATLTHAAAPPSPAEDDSLPHGAVARLGASRWRAGLIVRDLACSPNGRLLALADGAMQTARIFDAETGKVLHVLWGHRGSVMAVAFSPDGKRLLTTSLDKSVRIWDVATGESVRRIDLDWGVQRGTFTTDGKGIVLVDQFNQVSRFDIEGKLLGRFRPDNLAGIGSLSASSNRIAVMNMNGDRLHIIDTEGKPVVEIATTFNHIPQFSPDGERVALRFSKGIKVWNASNGNEVLSIEGDEAGKSFSSLVFSPDNKALLAEIDLGKVRIWDVATGKRICELDGSNSGLSGRVFSPDGKRIFLTASNAIRVFDARKGTRLNPEVDAECFLRCFAFSPDSKSILAGSSGSNVVTLWDFKSRKVVKRLPLGQVQRDTFVNGIAFSRDGKHAAAVGFGFPPIVWDIGSGKELHRFEGQDRFHCGAVFSDDGGTLFSAGFKDGVYRWDLKAGKELPALKSLRFPDAQDLELRSAGKSLVAHGSNVTAWLDPATGAEQQVNVYYMSARRLSSDGKTLAGVDISGRLQFYRKFGSSTVREGWQVGSATSLRFSPDDKQIAVATGRFVRVYEVEGKQLGTLVSDSSSTSLAYSPDGKWLAACDGTSVLLYEVAALGRVPAYRLSKSQWSYCLETLADKQVGVVNDTEWLLHAAGDSWVSLLRQRLTPQSL